VHLTVLVVADDDGDISFLEGLAGLARTQVNHQPVRQERPLAVLARHERLRVELGESRLVVLV
jgi:hypothetical protein